MNFYPLRKKTVTYLATYDQESDDDFINREWNKFYYTAIRVNEGTAFLTMNSHGVSNSSGQGFFRLSTSTGTASNVFTEAYPDAFQEYDACVFILQDTSGYRYYYRGYFYMDATFSVVATDLIADDLLYSTSGDSINFKYTDKFMAITWGKYNPTTSAYETIIDGQAIVPRTISGAQVALGSLTNAHFSTDCYLDQVAHFYVSGGTTAAVSYYAHGAGGGQGLWPLEADGKLKSISARADVCCTASLAGTGDKFTVYRMTGTSSTSIATTYEIEFLNSSYYEFYPQPSDSAVTTTFNEGDSLGVYFVPSTVGASYSARGTGYYITVHYAVKKKFTIT